MAMGVGSPICCSARNRTIKGWSLKLTASGTRSGILTVARGRGLGVRRGFLYRIVRDACRGERGVEQNGRNEHPPIPTVKAVNSRYLPPNP